MYIIFLSDTIASILSLSFMKSQIVTAKVFHVQNYYFVTILLLSITVFFFTFSLEIVYLKNKNPFCPAHEKLQDSFPFVYHDRRRYESYYKCTIHSRCFRNLQQLITN